MNIIYLIDSIAKKVGGVYMPVLSQQLPEMMLYMMKKATVELRYSLCKVRQTWKLLLAADILDKMDFNIRKFDSNWPHTQKEIKLLDEVKSVDEELELIRREIALLEQQQQQTEKLSNIKKRSRIDVTVGEKPPKKQHFEKTQTPKLNQDDDDLLRSSILLTPSPEPEPKCDTEESSFWANFGERKSTSPDLMSRNEYLPFLSEPKCQDDNKVVEAIEITDESMQVEQMETEETCTKLDSEEVPTTSHQSTLEQKFDEEIKKDDGLQLIEQEIPFMDLDDYIETTHVIPAALIKAEPKRSGYGNEFEEEEDEITSDNISMPTTESHRITSPPLNIDMYGNIAHQPAAEMPKTNKIKFNLTTVNTIQSCESQKKDIVIEKPKPKGPNEWETPSISFNVKESMKNVRFRETPILRKGVESSGMCSIM